MNQYLEVQWTNVQLDINDVSLRCLDSGGVKPCVMLLHGLAGYGAEWTATAAALVLRYRVIAFDQRGPGRSSRHPDDVSRHAFVADVAGIVLTLVGTKWNDPLEMSHLA